MTDEIQDNLFNELKSSQNKSNWDGTGLGLSIVFKLIQILNSKILFYSKLNHGSTFVFLKELSTIE